MTTALPRLPSYFISHGGGPWPYMPEMRDMMAPLADSLQAMVREIGVLPKAVLSVSGHWEAPQFTAMATARPPMVYDYHGFPEHTYRVQYPAPGAPDVAQRIQSLLQGAGIAAGLDSQRGFDHGTFAPLVVMYPDAQVPVLQLSLKHGYDAAEHLAVGRALAPLRDEGVLVMGSGNLTHNLASADLRARDVPVAPWASEFDAWVAERLDAWDLDALARFEQHQRHGRLAHPTSEHYEPLLVTCGAADGPRPPRVSHVFTGFEHATLSLRCVRFD